MWLPSRTTSTAGSLARRIAANARAALAAYGRHGSSQLAAAIAYRFLFSLVPFVALFASLLDLLLPEAPREQIVDWVFDEIPGEQVEASVDRAIAGSGDAAPLIGLASLAALLWGATGMMASIRTAVRIIWDVDSGRPYVRGKLLDFAFVAVAGGLVIVAFGLSLVAQVAVEAGRDVADAAGWNAEGRIAAGLAELGSSLLVTFLTFLLVYRVAPPVRLRVAELWPAALLGALAFQLVTAGFAFYLAHLSDFHAVYGPLGAVFAFLALVYALAVVLLGGAELAAARPGRRATPP